MTHSFDEAQKRRPACTGRQPENGRPAQTRRHSQGEYLKVTTNAGHCRAGAVNTLVLVCITEQRDGDGPVLVLERMELVGVALHAWDLLMMAYFGGRERDLAEMAALAADSGLDVRAVQRAEPNGRHPDAGAIGLRVGCLRPPSIVGDNRGRKSHVR